MREARLLRIGREIFLAALGMPLDTVEPWVLARLTTILEEREVLAGQTLFSAGSTSEFIYFMREGRVRYTRAGGPSWTFQGRWVLGGFEALGERPSTHTATALTTFRAMRVPITAWVEMLEDSFPIARSAVTNASRAVARLEELVPSAAPASAQDAPVLGVAPPGPLSLTERLALLFDVRMLRGVGVQALADLAGVSEQVSVASGDVLVARGRGCDRLLRIVDGEVVAERSDPSVARRYGPGDLVCGAAVLGGVVDAWEARAVTPTRCIAVPLESLFDLMEEHFELVRSTLFALGVRRGLLLDYLAGASGDLLVAGGDRPAIQSPVAQR
ncbi:MAG: cyclic nucleotide-binding domain-containing protein [Polyangiaceae bacterium]